MGWNTNPVHDSQWRVHPYWTKQSQALEQDRAAGGRARRVVQDCGALGRVVLRRRYLRLYAELRWQINNKECSKYLCEVSAGTRAANLAAGWEEARNLGLTTRSGAHSGRGGLPSSAALTPSSTMPPSMAAKAAHSSAPILSRR